MSRRSLFKLTGLALLSTSGCALLGASGPSNVAQGRYFASGNPRFDEFFIELHHYQVKLSTAPDLLVELRHKLAKRLEQSTSLTLQVVVEKVRHDAQQLAKQGTYLKLLTPEKSPNGSIAPTNAAIIKSGGKSLPKSKREFVTSLELSANEALTLSEDMAQSQRALNRLKARAIELEPQVDVSFEAEGALKAAEVRQNLEDAQKVILLLQARAVQIGEDARELLLELRKAVDTDDGRIAKSLKREAEPADSSKEDTQAEAEAKPKPAPRRKPRRTAPKRAPKRVPKRAPKPPPKPAAKAPPAPAKAPKPPATPEFEP